MLVRVVKNRYGAKLGLGYIATGGFIITVGLVTNEVNATLVAAVAGLLTLGSINAAETVASITEMSAQTKRVAEGDIDRGVSSSRGDEFGRLASSIEEMRVSLKQRISEMDAAQEELETARAEAEQAEQEAREMTEQYRRTAQEYGEVMEQAATGDLTQRIDVDTEDEALATIKDSFNRMMDDLQATVETVTEVAERIGTDAGEMVEMSTEVEQVVSGVVGSASEIHTQAEEQQQELESISADVGNISASAEEVATTIDDLSDRSEDVADASSDARTSSQVALEEMAEVEAEAQQAV
jgi:methyl-accepting chemotaxis protein